MTIQIGSLRNSSFSSTNASMESARDKDLDVSYIISAPQPACEVRSLSGRVNTLNDHLFRSADSSCSYENSMNYTNSDTSYYSDSSDSMRMSTHFPILQDERRYCECNDVSITFSVCGVAVVATIFILGVLTCSR